MQNTTWMALVSLFGVACLLMIPGTSVSKSDTVSRSEFEGLKDEIGSLKTELEALKSELKQIRELLSRRSSRKTQSNRVVSNLRVTNHAVLGKDDAPVSLIEFSDYQCPFCGKFFSTTLQSLKSEYIDTGKVRYIFRDFPLDRIHPQARKAAEAARCAGDQGRYWEMHDLLFQNQKELKVDHLKAYARQLSLDIMAFDTCLDRGIHAEKVQKDYEDGVAAGIKGTPGFFIGRTENSDTIQGFFINGAQPTMIFHRWIKRLMREPR